MEALKITKHFSKLTDAEIIYRIEAGEKSLYELLMRRNNQKLYRVIRGYIKNPKEIEDVMQDTYLKAYEKLHQFNQASEFSTWLIRIGINQALSRIKGNVRAINNLSNPTVINRFEELQTDPSNPEDLFIRAESKQLIENTIDLLDNKHKVVFIMKEIEGMSIKEIAACLDLSPSNVKVRLHRAKARMKELLIKKQMEREIFEFGFRRCDKLVNRVLGLI